MQNLFDKQYNIDGFDLSLKEILTQLLFHGGAWNQLKVNIDAIKNWLQDRYGIDSRDLPFNDDQDFYTYIDQSGKIVKKELARDYIVKDIKKIIVQENGIMNIEYKSYEKYFKLVEKHRCLLDIFLPESNYDKAKEIINSRINMVKEDILVQLDSKKNMDIKK